MRSDDFGTAIFAVFTFVFVLGTFVYLYKGGNQKFQIAYRPPVTIDKLLPKIVPDLPR